VSPDSDHALSLSVSQPVDGSWLVELSGDLDIASVADFGAQLAAVTAESPAHVVLELSQLQFIDSSGLNSLVVAAREMEGKGGSLVVAAPSTYVARVFDLVRLEESVEIAESVEKALAIRESTAGQAEP
jgi:anti-anti-sigma factor